MLQRCERRFCLPCTASRTRHTCILASYEAEQGGAYWRSNSSQNDFGLRKRLGLQDHWAFCLIPLIMGAEKPSSARQSSSDISWDCRSPPFACGGAPFIPSGWNLSTLFNRAEKSVFSSFDFLFFLSCLDRSGSIKWSAFFKIEGRNSSNTSYGESSPTTALKTSYSSLVTISFKSRINESMSFSLDSVQVFSMALPDSDTFCV